MWSSLLLIGVPIILAIWGYRNNWDDDVQYGLRIYLLVFGVGSAITLILKWVRRKENQLSHEERLTELRRPKFNWLNFLVWAFLLSLIGLFAPQSIPFIIGAVFWWCRVLHKESVRLFDLENARTRRVEQAKAQLKQIKGTAHFSTAAELKEHGLTSGQGLWFWQAWAADEREGKKWIDCHYNEATSIITVSPSGGGKFVTAIAPVLLTSEASFIVNDPKGEIFAVTAPFRRNLPNHEVYILDPFNVASQQTNHYNPLDDLDPQDSTFESDAGTLAGALIMSDGGQSFFTDGARKLVTGLIVYVCTAHDQPRTLSRVLELLNLPDDEWLVLMTKLKSLPYKVAQFAATPFLTTTPSRSTAETLNTARTQLGDFLPYGGIEAILSESDFSFRDIKQRGMTIYVVLPQAEALRFNRFTRLLFGWAVKLLQETPANHTRPPVCLLIDEMATSIGELDVIKKQFPLARGFGFQIWGIFQDVGQMAEVFGDHGYGSVLASAGLVQYFATSDELTIKTIQQRSGTYTRIIGEDKVAYQTYGECENVVAEQLLTVQAIQGLKKNMALLFKKDLAATIYQTRAHYNENPVLQSRAAPNPFAP